MTIMTDTYTYKLHSVYHTFNGGINKLCLQYMRLINRTIYVWFHLCMPVNQPKTSRVEFSILTKTTFDYDGDNDYNYFAILIRLVINIFVVAVKFNFFVVIIIIIK